MAQHPVNDFWPELAAVKLNLQTERSSGVHSQGDGISGLLVETKRPVCPFPTLIFKQLIELVLIEHQDTVKKGYARGHRTEPLGLHEWSVFEIAQGHPLGSQLSQPVQHCRVLSNPDAEWQCVHEQPQHLIRARNAGLATGTHHTIQNVILSAIAA